MASNQTALPDQLAHLRAKISALQVEEKALREILLADPSARLGGDYVATVKEVVSYRISAKDLEKADPVLFAKLATENVSKQVWLKPRVAAGYDDGEDDV